jgi:hypothetical protein
MRGLSLTRQLLFLLIYVNTLILTHLVNHLTLLFSLCSILEARSADMSFDARLLPSKGRTLFHHRQRLCVRRRCLGAVALSPAGDRSAHDHLSAGYAAFGFD